MSDADSKIIVLADHPKARAAWDIDYVDELLNTHRHDLQNLEDHIAALGNDPDKLDKERDCKNRAVEIQFELNRISDWLDDESEKSEANQERLTKLQAKCKKLIDRSERAKKTIADDMAASRHEENKWRLNPLQAFGALFGIVGGTIGLAKGQDETNQQIIMGLGTTFAIVGFYAAFRHSITKAFRLAERASVRASVKVMFLRKDITPSAFAAALIVSTVATDKNSITPRRPSPNTTGAKMVIIA